MLRSIIPPMASQPCFSDGLLATALLVAGRPQEALDTLNAYLDITGHGRNVRVESTYLRAVASYQVGRIDEAVQNWRYYVEYHPAKRHAEAAHRRLADAYAQLGNDNARAYHAARAEELGRLRGD